MEDVDCMKIYFKEARKIPLLIGEEEIELAKKVAQGDKVARQRMINANLRFVVKVAGGYLGRGISLEDLVGYGNQGLIMAVERYDVNKNAKFSTYAVWWIKQNILKAITNFSRTIKIHTYNERDLYKVKDAYIELSQKNGYFPSVAEISERTGLAEEEINHLLQVSEEPVSLEKTVGDEENRVIGDYVESEIIGPEEEFMETELKQEIEKALSEAGLSERGREIIEDRFGLKTGRSLTLEQLGKKYGITKEAIRLIQNRSLKKIRTIKSSRRLETYIYE